MVDELLRTTLHVSPEIILCCSKITFEALFPNRFASVCQSAYLDFLPELLIDATALSLSCNFQGKFACSLSQELLEGREILYGPSGTGRLNIEYNHHLPATLRTFCWLGLFGFCCCSHHLRPFAPVSQNKVISVRGPLRQLQ